MTGLNHNKTLILRRKSILNLAHFYKNMLFTYNRYLLNVLYFILGMHQN